MDKFSSAKTFTLMKMKMLRVSKSCKLLISMEKLSLVLKVTWDNQTFSLKFWKIIEYQKWEVWKKMKNNNNINSIEDKYSSYKSKFPHLKNHQKQFNLHGIKMVKYFMEKAAMSLWNVICQNLTKATSPLR